MYTILSNEKLGMTVENVRLAEIRQEIESQQLGDEVQGNRFGLKSLVQKVSHLVAARNADLPARDTNQTVAEI